MEILKNILPRYGSSAVLSKKEIDDLVKCVLEDSQYKDYEKYIFFKELETLSKQGLGVLQKPAVRSFISGFGGSLKEDVLGAEVQLTKPSIQQTFDFYTFSNDITNLEIDITAKEAELAELKKSLTLYKVMEINHGTAVPVEGAEKPEYSIKITLPKGK